MYSENEISTESINKLQSPPTTPLSILKQSWSDYLHSRYHNTSTFASRIALAEYFYSQEQSGRILYHMTTTYKPFEDRTYNERDVNKFFVNFYVKKFLRYVLDTSYINKNSNRQIQPICFCFVDDHEPKVVGESFGEIANNILSTSIRYRFAERLHHHAVLAVHTSTVDRIDKLIGENTLTHFSRKMMTSDLKRCDAGRVLYSSKMMHKYQDYLTFPDKMMSGPKNKRAQQVNAKH